ncbi:Tad domain-containing protein [Nocardioides sp. B-3]|uniref:Tad domain-containing protein n=1 Tax=Nocardioides sp. B-3 TaxID=2895565 RepID=UPI0021527FA9|nr:Tad domain-containing protein [Nocardioides sp. B-3]UUZ60136.1 Tad domain-containing protein [Nocardioides sp. B-3]
MGPATVLLMGIALVINASSAYLQRQSLDTLADGAALRGADLGAAGVYGEGLSVDRLLQEKGAVEKVVVAYLQSVGADKTYPGLDVDARELRGPIGHGDPERARRPAAPHPRQPVEARRRCQQHGRGDDPGQLIGN